jgi:hypothetical protein
MPWYRETKIAENTAEEAAQAYFDVLDTPANAWGRNQHPAYGDSRGMLSMMQSVSGAQAFDAAFSDICEEQRVSKNARPAAASAPRM